MNWISDEFSVHRDERITVQDENGDEYSLTIKELFDMMYGDRLKEITDQAKKEITESIQELKNEDVKEGIRA
jgi:ABC-type sugar transport system ATPase subunit